MRIIYLHQYFNTPEMPGGTRSYEMARRLVASGHEVEMITSWREEYDAHGWFATIKAGINIHWLPVLYNNKMGFHERLIAFMKFALGAAYKAIQLDGDVIFATSTPLTIAISGIIAAKFKRIPMVFEVRDLWPELPMAIGALKSPVLKLGARILEKIAYYNSSRIVALSPGISEGVAKTGYPCKKIAMIPNSCDLQLFRPDKASAAAFRNQFAWLGERPLIIYCGALGEINGVDYLARLAAETAEIAPDIRFAVIGRGKMESFIRDTAQKLGVLDKNFFMLDELPKQEIVAAFSAATISTSLFVDLPKMWANSANKFFDSLASGTPVLINYGGWQAEIIERYGVGFVVDVNSPEIAARELVNRISDKKWLKRAGIAAITLAKEEFSRDVLAGKLESVLAESVGRMANKNS